MPREENTLADEMSKLLIPDDSMLSRAFFRKLEERFGTYTVDPFTSGANNQCEKIYSLHWCRGTAGVSAFAFNWGGEPAWINCPFRLIGMVWRKLQTDASLATLLVPLWESANWWTLFVPDAIHFAEAVVNWVWLPKIEPTLFVPGVGPTERDVTPLAWPTMAVRVDFSAGATLCRLPLRDIYVCGGCDVCRSLKWHR